MLVLLRIAVGWHFLYQGLWKLNEPEFSSEGFLSQAKGPLAPYFHALVPDFDGRERLNPEGRALEGPNEQAEIEAALADCLEARKAFLDDFLENFQATYSLSEEQKEKAAGWVKVHQAALDDFFDEKREDLAKYLHELNRLDAARNDPAHAKSDQYLWDKQVELRGKARPLLAELEKTAAKCETDLNLLLTAEQRQKAPPQMPGKLARPWQDKVVTYSNLVIGACLIAGLFTRLSAFFGGLFLAMIVAAQPDWPGLVPTPHPSAGRSLAVNKEFIEMTVLFALAASPVGRWGGLDFFVHCFLSRRRASQKDAR